MSRGGGSVCPGGIYHVISRFTASEWFIESGFERRTYLSLLGQRLSRTDWRCFSFAVMSNHVHLGVVAGSEPLADWLQPAHTDFAKWINQRRERIGAIFVKGPNVIAVQPAGVAHVISYIHHNPVRATAVTRPEDSDWTSHRAYLGLARCPPWLDVRCGLELGGFDNARDLAAWMEVKRIDRAALEAVYAKPRRRRGRPRRSDY
jgi:REP element-mobilizing transposase RayT